MLQIIYSPMINTGHLCDCTSFILKKAMPVSSESDPAWCCRPILFNSSWSATSCNPPCTNTNTKSDVSGLVFTWFDGFCLLCTSGRQNMNTISNYSLKLLRWNNAFDNYTLPPPPEVCIQPAIPLGSCSSSSSTWHRRLQGRTGWGSGRSHVPPQGAVRLSGASPGSRSRSRWKIQSSNW